MNRGKWICLLLAWIIIFSCVAEASDPIRSVLLNKISNTYQLDSSKVTVEIRTALFISDSTQFDSLNITGLPEAVPRGLITVSIDLYKEHLLKMQTRAQVNFKHYENVLIAADDIRRNEIVSPEKCRIEKMEISSLVELPYTDISQLKGKWAKRFIRKGQIFTSGIFEDIPTVISGQTINIIYQTPKFEIAARGKALQTGYSGEIIRVQNLQSYKIVSGTVVDTKTVAVAN